MNDWVKRYEQDKARRAAIDHCRMMIHSSALFYPLLFMATMGATMAGVDIDTYTAVAIVFHVFPLGFAATCGLKAIFELYAWVIE